MYPVWRLGESLVVVDVVVVVVHDVVGDVVIVDAVVVVVHDVVGDVV